MITRENYEEFFLLYTDNELSAAEKQEVERFISHHPDLRDEWEALLQCRLLPEQHIGFPDKRALHKTEAGEHRYTDYFLSYIDSELDVRDRAAVEEILRQHPQHRKEFGELQQTICHPDPAVVFPDKASLYKKEDGRIIPLPWIRFAVAAAVAGAVALVFFLPRSHRKDTRPDAALAQQQAPAGSPTTGDAGAGSTKASSTEPRATTTGATTAGTTAAAAHPGKITTPVTPTTTRALYSSTGQQHKEKTGAKKNRPAGVENKEEQQDIAGAGNPVEQVAILPRKTEPEKGTREVDPAGTLPDRTLPAGGEMAANVHLAVQTGIPKEQSSFATQALQEEANDQQNNNFVVDEPAAPAKAKLRGIFRKVTRVFGKTADRDKDGNRQVVIGGFPFAIN